MFRSLLIIFILLPLKTFALELKVGDLLLQPLNCWSCSLIEEQENSIYSHMGIVIQTSPEIFVAEALGTVHMLGLKEFNSRTQKNQKILIRRFKDSALVRELQKNQSFLIAKFKFEYQGLDYDDDFLWDNFDENNNEKLYCSEMIGKFLESFTGLKMPIKRMKYDKNREHWISYFKKNPPDGKWGNAPADFERSSLFYDVGEL